MRDTWRPKKSFNRNVGEIKRINDVIEGKTSEDEERNDGWSIRNLKRVGNKFNLTEDTDEINTQEDEEKEVVFIDKSTEFTPVKKGEKIFDEKAEYEVKESFGEWKKCEYDKVEEEQTPNNEESIKEDFHIEAGETVDEEFPFEDEDETPSDEVADCEVVSEGESDNKGIPAQIMDSIGNIGGLGGLGGLFGGVASSTASAEPHVNPTHFTLVNESFKRIDDELTNYLYNLVATGKDNIVAVVKNNNYDLSKIETELTLKRLNVFQSNAADALIKTINLLKVIFGDPNLILEFLDAYLEDINMEVEENYGLETDKSQEKISKAIRCLSERLQETVIETIEVLKEIVINM